MRTSVSQTAAHCLAHVRRFSLCTHRTVAVVACLLSMLASTAADRPHAYVAAFAVALAACLTCIAREYLRHSVILALGIRADREIYPLGSDAYGPQDTVLDYRTTGASHRHAVVRHSRTVRQ